MLLELAAIAVLAERCAPQISPLTLIPVIRTESGFDPLAIGVNGPLARALKPASKAEAIATAAYLINQGRSIDLGLAQINSKNLARLGLTIRDAFDPCQNLAAAGRILAADYRYALQIKPEPQAALRIALSRYNTGHDTRGFSNGYVSRVVRHAARPSGVATPPPTEAPATANASPQMVFEGAASPQLLFAGSARS